MDGTYLRFLCWRIPHRWDADLPRRGGLQDVVRTVTVQGRPVPGGDARGGAGREPSVRAEGSHASGLAPLSPSFSLFFYQVHPLD